MKLKALAAGAGPAREGPLAGSPSLPAGAPPATLRLGVRPAGGCACTLLAASPCLQPHAQTGLCLLLVIGGSKPAWSILAATHAQPTTRRATQSAGGAHDRRAVLPHCEYSEYPCEYSGYQRGPGGAHDRRAVLSHCGAVRRTHPRAADARAGVLAGLDCAAKSAAAVPRGVLAAYRVPTAARPLRQCCPQRTGTARQQTKPQPAPPCQVAPGLLVVATGRDRCNMQPGMLRAGGSAEV